MSGQYLKPTFVGESELPQDVGTPQGPTVNSDEIDPVGRHGTWTLSGLANSHRLFHPGLIRAAGLITDPVALAWAENGLDPKEAPFVVDIGWNAFAGIPAPECHTVLACPIHHAKFLIPALSRVRFGTLEAPIWDVIHQRLRLLDRKLLSSLTHKPARPPEVEIDVFGLAGPTQSLLWRPTPDPWTGGFRLMQVAATKPTRRPFSPATS